MSGDPLQPATGPQESAPAVTEGESLFVDFEVTFGFDNHGARDHVLTSWRCRICPAQGQGQPAMAMHAREHADAT